MGFAIAGMHYTAMAAAIFSPGSVCLSAGRGVNQDVLSLVLAIATTGVLLIALITSELKARLQTKENALARSNASVLLKQEMLNQELIARELAEHTSKLKDEFLAMLSHELRTPLSAIAGWTDLLKRGIADEIKREKAIDAISRNVRIQSELIDELLDMSRIMSGKIVLDLQPVDLNTVVSDALDNIRPSAESKHLRLAIKLHSSPVLIDGDKTRLAQIFSNLLTNAVKFTPIAGTIILSLAYSKGSARVTVRDTGIGISQQFLPHVFERFCQENASTTLRFGGLGLGLSIVHDLVLLHGGSISVESAGENQGATFIVAFPGLAIEEYEDSTSFMPAEPRVDAPRTRKEAANADFGERDRRFL
jgi:signal transduction histidine kinase